MLTLISALGFPCCYLAKARWGGRPGPYFVTNRSSIWRYARSAPRLRRHSERGKPAERRTQTRSSSHRSKKIAPFRKLIQFPQAKGKIVEAAEFSTAPGYHNISINFQDKTCLNFSIETGFSLETDYSDWKTGNQSVLRVWRPITSKK